MIQYRHINVWVQFGVFIFIIILLNRSHNTQTIVSIVMVILTVVILFSLAMNKYKGVRDVDLNRYSQLENILLETDLITHGIQPKKIVKYIYLDQSLTNAIIFFNNNYCYIDKHACRQINSLLGQFYNTFALCMNNQLNVDHSIEQLHILRKHILNTLHEFFVKSSSVLDDGNFNKIIKLYQSATYRAMRVVGKKFKKHVKPPYAVSEYVFLENFNVFV